jgi:pimeloyl-ACP methyl ester carboxylesterase
MDQAKIIASFLESIDARNVILCGNSFGGGVSLMTYFMIPEPERHERIGALILIDAAAYPQKLPFFMDALTWPLIHSMVPILSPQRRAQMVLQQAFHNDSKITEDRVRRHAQFLSLPGHYRALVATAKQIIPDNWDAFIGSIKRVNVPTLILWGEKDAIIPIDHARRFAGEIPNSTLQIISGCGHIPQEECPEATADHIRAFADRIRQA